VFSAAARLFACTELGRNEISLIDIVGRLTLAPAVTRYEPANPCRLRTAFLDGSCFISVCDRFMGVSD